jgi:hypothetical protein
VLERLVDEVEELRQLLTVHGMLRPLHTRVFRRPSWESTCLGLYTRWRLGRAGRRRCRRLLGRLMRLAGS